ncbi:uncharacterized protein LOC143807668 isoform X2 [Ranitomeya variabilis]|uniref:uncharacterized protein LOC143807668 isoform X2 n=1 Tax=Ranitomeya variabilis TaxID=490064 RepID=UPI0040573148
MVRAVKWNEVAAGSNVVSIPPFRISCFPDSPLTTRVSRQYLFSSTSTLSSLPSWSRPSWYCHHGIPQFRLSCFPDSPLTTRVSRQYLFSSPSTSSLLFLLGAVPLGTVTVGQV